MNEAEKREHEAAEAYFSQFKTVPECVTPAEREQARIHMAGIARHFSRKVSE